MVTLKEFWVCQSRLSKGVRYQSYSADDLMDMRRWIRARINQGIETLDGKLCASEAEETSVSWCKKPGGGDEAVPLHRRTRN
jgi:hypothetical protein